MFPEFRKGGNAVKDPILLGDHPRDEIRTSASAFKRFCRAVFVIAAVFCLETQNEKMAIILNLP